MKVTSTHTKLKPEIHGRKSNTMTPKYLKHIIKFCLLIMCVFNHPSVFALEDSNNNNYYGLFGEKIDENWIGGIYVRSLQPRSMGYVTFRFSALAASITNPDENNDQVNFVTVDGSIGYQLGRELYLYTDIGIDLGELIAWLKFSDDDATLDPDRYFTVGTGIALGNVSLNLYTKYRHLSGFYVAKQSHWFQGLELGMKF